MQFIPHSKQSVARRRFDAASAKGKVLDNFWESMRDQSVDVVMHGIAHVDPSGKEEPTEPVQDVAKIAKRQVQVLATPEHNTTQHNTTTLCAGCQKEAQKCGQRHRSIRCRSTECVEQRRRCRKDRDVKACKSIRHAGVSLEEHGEAPFPRSTRVQPAMLIVASRRWMSKEA